MTVPEVAVKSSSAYPPVSDCRIKSAPIPRLEESYFLDQKRVFIVDDNEDVAAALSAMLHLSGYVTATAT